jgi:hypothetical protein
VANLDATDPRDSAYGREYWLHRCEGFRVESAGREIGRVRGLRFRGSLEPELLEVRSGLFGRRVLLIPVERVSEVVPKEKRVLLRPDSLPSNSDADGE